MKKIIALLLAVIMVMGLATIVSAEAAKYAPTEAQTIQATIGKTYTSTEEFVPGEELTFSVAGPTPAITVGNGNKITVDAMSEEIAINLPSYSAAGTYTYTVTEVKGNTAGVTYDETSSVEVKVIVGYDNANMKLVVLQTVIKEGDAKSGNFENVFNTNDVTVSKVVTGNMANKNDTFKVKVTLTSDKPVLTTINVAGSSVENWKTVDGKYVAEVSDISISAVSGITISDVPHGVKVKVEETDLNGYTLKGYKVGETETNEVTVGAAAQNIEITNEKKTEVETGIAMDSVPFIVMAVIAVLGLAAFTAKKRVQE